MFIAGYNMPGYMPEAEPATYESWAEAFAGIKYDIETHYEQDCQDTESGDYTDSFQDAMSALANVQPETVFTVQYGAYVYWLERA